MPDLRVHGTGVDSSRGNFVLCYRLCPRRRPMLMDAMLVRSVALLAAVMHVLVRVRDELLAAAFRAKIEIASAVLRAMLGVLGNRHSADDIDHSIRTRLIMVMMRMCSAVAAMCRAAAAAFLVRMLAIH